MQYYGERLGLTEGQKDVLDRLLAERQTVPNNPRIIAGIRDVLGTFRQYLNVDQVAVYETLMAQDR